MKKFQNKVYNGTVTTYDATRAFYMITYEDGDREEMTREQVEKYRCNDIEKDRPKRYTLSIHEANTCVRRAKTTTIPLPPHYAMAVFDEDSGKMMEYRHLITHKNPAIKKRWQR